jgi:hypothetical protein
MTEASVKTVFGHSFLEWPEPIFTLMASAATGETQEWVCDKEPEKSQPLADRKPEARVVAFKSIKRTDPLQLIRDVADAFTDAFPELQFAPSERNQLLIMGDNRKRQTHYLTVAEIAARLLDIPELRWGYYIGNHIVRLKAGNACDIALLFKDAPEMRIIGLGEKVLLIIPKSFDKSPTTDQPEISIALERKVAGFKSTLIEADGKIAKAQKEDKEKAKKKPQRAQAKPSLAEAKSSVSTPIEKQPETPKKEEPGKKPGTEPKSDTSEDSLAARTVKFEALNAFTVAWAFRDKFPGYHFSPLSSNLLIILGGEHAPMTLEEVKKNLAAADAAAKPKQEPTPERAQGSIVRLFHFRNPKAVVDAFKRDDEEPVKAVGTDLVLINPKDASWRRFVPSSVSWPCSICPGHKSGCSCGRCRFLPKIPLKRTIGSIHFALRSAFTTRNFATLYNGAGNSL